ncbi:MAG: universal stress protein, partial [Acidimicrobiia bacterium]|nr:universal stress protein [Acidimicrobiia bacterium]
MESWKAKLIIVGVDGSDASVDAASVAASLARSAGARLHIVTVVKPPEGWWGIIESPPTASALGNALEEAQRKVLDLTTSRVDLDGIEYETVEEIGDPGRALAGYCEQHEADLLV